MRITEQVIPVIEKAIGFELYESQKQYLLNDAYVMSGGRRVGKTVAYCIKLALSEGEPLNLKKPYKFSDYGDGSLSYAHNFFRQEFMKYWYMLKDYGFPVREVKF